MTLSNFTEVNYVTRCPSQKVQVNWSFGVFENLTHEKTISFLMEKDNEVGFAMLFEFDEIAFKGQDL